MAAKAAEDLRRTRHPLDFRRSAMRHGREEPLLSAARGRGLFLAFDLPDAKTREEFWHGFFDLGVLTLRSGENSLRFRPALDITAEVIDEAMDVMRKYCRQRPR